MVFRTGEAAQSGLSCFFIQRPSFLICLWASFSILKMVWEAEHSLVFLEPFLLSLSFFSILELIVYPPYTLTLIFSFPPSSAVPLSHTAFWDSLIFDSV